MRQTRARDHQCAPSEQRSASPPERPARVPALSAVMQRAAADAHALTRADATVLQRTIGNAAVARLLANATPRENRTGLPDRLKAGVENLSGLALDDVRVHYNSAAPARLQALAYTQAPDIHVAPGQEQHLPHEAWHVVQQKQGRVKPTLQLKGVAINDDQGLEHEADAAGRRAAATEPNQLLARLGSDSETAQSGATPRMADRSVIQRIIAGGESNLDVTVDAQGKFQSADRKPEGVGARLTDAIADGHIKNDHKRYLAAHLIKAQWGGEDDITKNVVVWDENFEKDYAAWENEVTAAMQSKKPGTFPVRVKVAYYPNFAKERFGTEGELKKRAGAENLDDRVVPYILQLESALDEVPLSVYSVATIGQPGYDIKFGHSPLARSGQWALQWQQLNNKGHFTSGSAKAKQSKEQDLKNPNKKDELERRKKQGGGLDLDDMSFGSWPEET